MLISLVWNNILTLILSRNKIDISNESDGKMAYTPNEENLDSIVH